MSKADTYSIYPVQMEVELLKKMKRVTVNDNKQYLRKIFLHFSVFWT